MGQLGFWKKSVRGNVWDDLERQEARKDDHAPVIRFFTQDLKPWSCASDICWRFVCAREPPLRSCTRKLWLHTRLFRDRFRKESNLCSNWIACTKEVPWACLQCHPVGTGRAVLVLLGNAPCRKTLLAVLHWGASDAINHRAREMKSLRKMRAALHLVLVNKIGNLE